MVSRVVDTSVLICVPGTSSDEGNMSKEDTHTTVQSPQGAMSVVKSDDDDV